MTKIQRVLVANRGEIAVRVIRGCRELGIETVAVCSDVDSAALHVRMADQVVPLGGMTAAESYLDTGKILAAVDRSGADAVHPGYGFLSENASFARALAEAGVALIGPSPEVMEVMGDKAAARRTAEAAGVPVVPGLVAGEQGGEALELAEQAAAAVGFPMLVKAAFGGGGKGMRVVQAPEELAARVSEASREAASAFGDGTLYFERYLARPRHIEIQVFGDDHGNFVSLGERECSIQRRHQKLIEETPSTAVSPELRARMGEAAVRLARQVDYRGAGTVEFLLDEDGSFYFIEMNTRLQVEHTVTEMVTGLDLVKEQLRVARGEPLSCGATPPTPRGHSIQCRISAEDPLSGFAPSTGEISVHVPPRGPSVRVDDGIGEKGEISLYYDPMFAKLVVWGADRAEATARMRAALTDYMIVGVHTTIPFHLEVLASAAWQQGETDIRFVEEHWGEGDRRAADQGALAMVLAAAIAHAESERALPRAPRDRHAWRGQARQSAILREPRR